MSRNKVRKTESESVKETSVVLDRMSKAVALLVVKDQGQTKQINTLVAIGFSPKEIASLLGTTSNTVNVRLSEQRASSKRKKE